MNTSQIKEKILTNETFVEQEIQKILTYYQLKHTLRWSHNSAESDEKESVAEHVFGMYVLSNYFLPLQDTQLDQMLVQELILWHDMSEALVDDMTTLSKTDSHKQAEKEAEIQLIAKAPAHITNKLADIFSIYNKQETSEAKFVKAIDKLEPLFQIKFISGQTSFIDNSFKRQMTTEILDRYQQNRLQYISDFPDILQFSKVLSAEIKNTNYIHPEA